MRHFLLILIGAVLFSNSANAAPVRRYGNECQYPQDIHRLQRWIETLDAVAQAGDGYIAGPWANGATYEEYVGAFLESWHGGPNEHIVRVSCAGRCGGRARTYGFWGYRGTSVDYAIFCKCENLVNHIGEPPWPREYRR